MSVEFKTAEDYREGLQILVNGLPEKVADRLLGTLEQIENCESGIPIQNWCPMCLGKMLLVMRIIRVERDKIAQKVLRSRGRQD